MPKVYSHHELAQVHLVKHELEHRGIETVVRGQHLAAIAGGGAAGDAWPELWIVDPARFAEADGLVRDVIAGDPAGAAELWTCPDCAEEVDGTFAVCWNCGGAPAAEGPG